MEPYLDDDGQPVRAITPLEDFPDLELVEPTTLDTALPDPSIPDPTLLPPPQTSSLSTSQTRRLWRQSWEFMDLGLDLGLPEDKPVAPLQVEEQSVTSNDDPQASTIGHNQTTESRHIADATATTQSTVDSHATAVVQALETVPGLHQRTSEVPSLTTSPRQTPVSVTSSQRHSV